MPDPTEVPQAKSFLPARFPSYGVSEMKRAVKILPILLLLMATTLPLYAEETCKVLRVD